MSAKRALAERAKTKRGTYLSAGILRGRKEVGGVVKDAFRGWSVEFSTRHFVRILVSNAFVFDQELALIA